MDRQAEICMTLVLCTVIVLSRVYGSKGSVSYLVNEDPSYLLEKLPFFQRIGQPMTSRYPSIGIDITSKPSKVLAFSVLAPHGWDGKGNDIAPSPQRSYTFPSVSGKASSPAYHGKSTWTNSPSPLPILEGSPPPIKLPSYAGPVPQTAPRLSPNMQSGAPSDYSSPEYKQFQAKAPLIESREPSIPGQTVGASPSNPIPPHTQARKPVARGRLHGIAPSSTPRTAPPPISSPVRKSQPPTTIPSIFGVPPSIAEHLPHVKSFHRPTISPTLIPPPVIDKRIHGVPVAAPPNGMPKILSHVHHSHSRGLFPVLSPLSHEATVHWKKPPAPFISRPPSPARRIFRSPASAPTRSYYHPWARKHVISPLAAPSYNTDPGIPLAPSLPPTTSPKDRQRNVSPPPLIQGPSLSPFRSPSSPIATEGAPATSAHGSFLSPVQSPSSSSATEGSPAPLPLSMTPSSTEWPIQPPVVSPVSSSAKPRSPKPQPARALPPPPPNLDCTALTCTEPFTNTPPGSPCACVQPMRVGLRLSVELYSFFPLVLELAKDIAAGVFMKQSQVRVMGANAASEQPEKTIVFIDLVPLGERFDNTTAFLTYERFWHKQVGIKSFFFGSYDVLYVIYPGLPPSPTAPADINVNDGSFGNGNNAGKIHPLGVDVSKQKEKLSGSLIAIAILSSVIALVLCAGAVWLLLLKRKDHTRLPASISQTSMPKFVKATGIRPLILGSGPSSESASFSSIATYTGSAKTFGVAEMERATNKFDDSRILGEGGFGRVYQGTLEDGTSVAIKVLKREDQQGGREFLAEVEMLSRLHHRNLVKLIGICTEEHLRCLIYELIPNGSVESHLHGADKEIAPLDWGPRMKIALGSARGLAYLHEDSSPRVIHRDFKSSNILLEFDFTPKVSDFGLARTALDEGKEQISTRVMGTFGYVAPEYAMTGHLLVKSDVYSYGVVLLELLTGRKPVDMLQPPGQENLVTWARPLLTSKEGLETIIDPALGSHFPFDSVAKVAAIASMCVQPEVSHRPFMGEVVQALKLVCTESDEYKGSGSCSQEDLCTQDTEVRISTRLGFEAERTLSPSDMFYTSARFTREASGSFRRHSSSGPLRTNRSRFFWQRARGLSRGSMSEHGLPLRFGRDVERCDQLS